MSCLAAILAMAAGYAAAAQEVRQDRLARVTAFTISTVSPAELKSIPP